MDGRLQVQMNSKGIIIFCKILIGNKNNVFMKSKPPSITILSSGSSLCPRNGDSKKYTGVTHLKVFH